MPSDYSTGSSITDAKKLTDQLSIKLNMIKIQDLLNSFKKETQETIDIKKNSLTEQNLQTRIRGDILMAIANKMQKSMNK